jgi:hypothetical protein
MTFEYIGKLIKIRKSNNGSISNIFGKDFIVLLLIFLTNKAIMEEKIETDECMNI